EPLAARAARATLSNSEMGRYSRHLVMPEVGLQGQKRLKASAVLLIGAGGLGSPLALYLAAAGVGRLGLVDFDTVDFTNLHRRARCPAAPRAASWASCRAWSAASRPPRASSCCWASAPRSSAGCCSTTRCR